MMNVLNRVDAVRRQSTPMLNAETVNSISSVIAKLFESDDVSTSELLNHLISLAGTSEDKYNLAMDIMSDFMREKIRKVGEAADELTLAVKEQMNSPAG